MIDAKASRGAFQDNDINIIRWIRSCESLVKGLMKTSQSQALEKLPDIGFLSLKKEPQIVQRSQSGEQEWKFLPLERADCQQDDAKVKPNYDHDTIKDDDIYDTTINWTEHYNDRKTNDGSEHTANDISELSEILWERSLLD